MNVFDFSLKLNGFPIAKAKRILKDIQSKTETDFNAFAEAQKRAIVAYHLEHNPFYKSFGKHIDLNDWNSIPVMTKANLQQPLEQRLSDGFTTKNVYINKTSGSSGHPFIFAKDKFCHALTWAVFNNHYNQYNIDLNHAKQARFYGIPLNKKGYYKERIKDFMGNRFRFSVFNLTDTEFEKTLNKFKNTKFNYINGYTSAIVQLAKFLKRKNLNLKNVCPTLEACIVTSEMLFDSDKELLENHLGVPIINEYGAAEIGLIAFTNLEGKWQLNQNDLFIETLDDNNKALPYGKTGRVVITSLYNKAQPFIRYDIGDIGTITKSTHTNAAFLNTLTGRTSDIVILPSGKQAAGLTFYYVTKTIIEDNANVKEFIIEQLELSVFKISYVSTIKLSLKEEDAITKAVTKYLEPNLTVIFDKKNQLTRNKSGKLKQFTSYL